MKRKDFIQMAGMGLGSLVLPKLPFGTRMIDPSEAFNAGMDVAVKKQLSDVALNAAKAKGATYTDVRIGRYLNQFIITRENRIQNIVNTESFGVGIRVIANGSWGFAATNDVTKEGVARTAERAVAVARANAKIISEPVQLAPQKGYGEVSWKTPIGKNAFEVPIKEKVDLLLNVNGIAMKGGANFINSAMLAVNEQK
ncbi:MAG TPA: DNA gyrase modulator, partial [Puia sp.]